LPHSTTSLTSMESNPSLQWKVIFYTEKRFHKDTRQKNGKSTGTTAVAHTDFTFAKPVKGVKFWSDGKWMCQVAAETMAEYVQGKSQFKVLMGPMQTASAAGNTTFGSYKIVPFGASGGAPVPPPQPVAPAAEDDDDDDDGASAYYTIDGEITAGKLPKKR
jgi:hypothetical protein